MVSGAEHLVFTQHGMFCQKEGSNLRATTKDRGATSQQARQHFAGLILDEEEERRVFHSLLVGRVKRLCSLVERLHQVADRDGRPVHIRVLHNFRERCKPVLSALKSQEKNDQW